MTIDKAISLLSEMQMQCLTRSDDQSYDDPLRAEKARALSKAISAMEQMQEATGLVEKLYDIVDFKD